MITSVCLNPCVDKTVTIGKFAYGGMNRVTSSRLDYVGKGVNVALNLAALGHESFCAGLIAKEGGKETLRNIEDGGARHDFAVLPGSVRVNMKVVDASSAVVTEINEQWSVAPAAYEAAEELVLRNAKRSDWVVLTGSLPVGLEPDTYARLMRALRREAPQCKVALDAEGDALSLALAEAPDFIKPNDFEASMIANARVDEPAGACRVALGLLERGVPRVVLSMGGKGAVCVTRDYRLFAPAIDVNVRSTAGAGDAMLAGFLAGVTEELCDADAFRLACAAAAAKVETEGTRAVTLARCKALLPRVALRDVAL